MAHALLHGKAALTLGVSPPASLVVAWTRTWSTLGKSSLLLCHLSSICRTCWSLGAR
jgi:hypothetical protein